MIDIQKCQHNYYNFINQTTNNLNKSQSQMQQQQQTMDNSYKAPQHQYVIFSEPRQPKILFNSRFDSGNMGKVVRNTYDNYSIWTASDCQGTQFEAYPKSWFYFQVGGFVDRYVSFSIHRVHFLWAMSKKNHLYRPVYRVCRKLQNEQDTVTDWERLPNPIISLSLNNEDQLVLKFDFNFQKAIKWVEFAFIYPYSYTQCREHIRKIKDQFQITKDQQLSLKTYEFCKSYQGRIIDLLLISSHEGKQGYENIKYDQVMTFGGEKLLKYRSNKPIIFISARVHPIETPSSYTMNGIIQFLTNKKDMRAHLLRKYFVFVLVPMLNPDGVANGHCRMDNLNQNLNRYYKNPDPIRQPSCYAIKKLCEHYNKEQRIFMYIDLHAHPANKGNFIFGNAIFDYIQQVQSHLFPKMLSQNCINFQFQQCNFSRKHMKAKDRFQDMNKEGCGRVVFYRQFGVGHSYTLQCGYHTNTYNNPIIQPKQVENTYAARYKLNENNEKIYDGNQKIINTQKIQQMKSKNITNNTLTTNYDYFSFTYDELENPLSSYYQRDIVFFNQSTFKNLGKNILVSILDIWNKNPYTRIININDQRKQIADKQSKLDRFRKQQTGIKAKQKKIIQLIEEQFYGNWHKRNVMIIQSMNTQAQINKKIQIIGRSSQKVRRTQKTLTLQTKIKSLNNNKNLQSEQPNNQSTHIIPDKNTYSVNANTQPSTINPSNLNVPSDSTQTILKLTQSKNIFRPTNVRIRNLIMSTNK